MYASGRQQGFTLIEFLIVIAILGVLAGLGMTAYHKYIVWAGADDLIAKHHELRNKAIIVMADLGGEVVDDCSDLANRFDQAGLADRYATFGYGFEAVADGFRPVLTVCASADAGGGRGVQVARRAYEKFAEAGNAESGAVLTDTLASYSLSLVPGDEAMCRKASSVVASACGPQQPVQPQPQPQQPAQPQAQAPADDCKDTYLGNCAQDFAGLCDDPYVQSVCQKTCNACGSSAPPQAPVVQAAAQPAPSYVDPSTNPDAPRVTRTSRDNPASFGSFKANGDTHWDLTGILWQAGLHTPESREGVKVTDIQVDHPGVTTTQNPDGRWTVHAPNVGPTGTVLITVTVDNGKASNVIVFKTSAS